MQLVAILSISGHVTMVAWRKVERHSNRAYHRGTPRSLCVGVDLSSTNEGRPLRDHVAGSDLGRIRRIRGRDSARSCAPTRRKSTRKLY